MCDPVTATAAVLMVAGTAMSAYGSYQEGKAENEAAKFNANMEEQKAKDAKERGLADEATHARKVAQLKGAQRAQWAADGVDLSSGTPSEIFEQTAEWGERDRQTIEHNTEREIWTHRQQANLYRAQGKNAKRAGTIGAFSSILTGSANTMFGAKAATSNNKPPS